MPKYMFPAGNEKNQGINYNVIREEKEDATFR